MRFFTDKDGNFNWSAVGSICAVVGATLAVLGFFMSGPKQSATAQNVETVIGTKITVGKIQGITLQEYEEGLLRREQEVIERLEDDQLSAADTQTLRETLKQIDTRQSDLENSYENVEKLTEQIRIYHENLEDQGLVEDAIAAIFDGDLSSAATKAMAAGIPIDSVQTIENTGTIFQRVMTEADFKKFVAGREIVKSDNTRYTRVYGSNGSIDGYVVGQRSGSGGWGWIDGQFCEEFNDFGTHYGQHCFPVFVSNSAVKFQHSNENIAIYTK